jgi:hypothetical protein
MFCESMEKLNSSTLIRPDSFPNPKVERRLICSCPLEMWRATYLREMGMFFFLPGYCDFTPTS